jgi:hypothetical protein
MNTLFFLLFCFAVLYVSFWTLRNDRNASGITEGWLAMRQPSERPGSEAERTKRRKIGEGRENRRGVRFEAEG